MKRLSIVLFLCAMVGATWFYLSIHSYHQWFNTHLMGTVWTPLKERELAEILCQTFQYCGQGSSSKAYASEDGRFVIKTFIKNQFQDKKFKHIPILRDLAAKRKEVKAKYKRARGPINAYQYIPEESGMIFYQFISPRNLFKRSLRLIEKDGSISALNLDEDEYLIQKKAVIVEEYLQSHLAKGDLELVNQGISKLLRLTKVLYDQGIVLSTLQLLDNFGFIDDEPIRIDVEHLRFDPAWKTAGMIHLRKELPNFRAWLVDNAPIEVVEFFDSEIQSIWGDSFFLERRI